MEERQPGGMQRLHVSTSGPRTALPLETGETVTLVASQGDESLPEL
jgi:hypothetical protein